MLPIYPLQSSAAAASISELPLFILENINLPEQLSDFVIDFFPSRFRNWSYNSCWRLLPLTTTFSAFLTLSRALGQGVMATGGKRSQIGAQWLPVHTLLSIDVLVVHLLEISRCDKAA